MAQQDIQQTTLSNGLTVLVETMSAVQSASFALLVPAGSLYDSPGCNGTAAALADWISRGAGNRSSRELLAEFDRLGVQARETASVQHLIFSGACLASNLNAVWPLYADILRRPHFDDTEFEAVMAGIEHGLLAIEDEPRQKVMLELVRCSYPHPWGRPPEGTLSDLPNITAETVRQHFGQTVKPQGAILGIAGNVRLSDIESVLERELSGWTGENKLTVQTGDRGPFKQHLSMESAQTQIGLAYPAVSYPDPDYYAAWAAVEVLSGGMSSRLFTEVREKRGLCYSVYATLSSQKERGQVLCYAGTTSERAQETLDVLRTELARLGDGIEQAELDRCRARAKSALVMAQESSGSRASSLARNWYLLGRVLSLDEVQARINSLTVDSVLDYVHRHPAGDFTTLTIGPNELA